jgi:hypothetical protein
MLSCKDANGNQEGYMLMSLDITEAAAAQAGAFDNKLQSAKEALLSAGPTTSSASPAVDSRVQAVIAALQELHRREHAASFEAEDDDDDDTRMCTSPEPMSEVKQEKQQKQQGGFYRHRADGRERGIKQHQRGSSSASSASSSSSWSDEYCMETA